MSKLLSDATEEEIYRLYTQEDRTQASLARMYGVSTRTISRVIRRVKDNLFSYPEPNLYDESEDDDLEYSIDDVDFDYDGYDVEEAEYTFVATNQSISVTKTVIDDEGFAVSSNSETIDDTHPNFKKVYDLIWATRGSNKALEECFTLMNVRREIEAYSHRRIRVDPERGKAVFVKDNGQERDLPHELSDRLLNAVRSGTDDVQALCNFADKLYDNPSYKSVQGLYRFLVAKNIMIDPDGNVLCYKKVRDDFTDCYTGTLDNSVGQTVEVDRNEVDEDDQRTCSHGLHVCSASYLDNFGGPRVIQCLVHPADFVAVPPDYSGSKARVCRYTVIADLTDQYNRGEIIV